MADLTLNDEMIERAARVLDRSYDRTEMTLQQVAREVLEAAFEGVPMINYGIGTALQFFDLVICVKETEHAAAAGVYRLNGEPGGFEDCGHTIEVNWGSKPRYIKRVAISKIDAPGPVAVAPRETQPAKETDER